MILLSDVDGLYTANPATDPTAQRLSVVKSLTSDIMAMATGETRSGMGSGGMAAKLLAARMAGAARISLAICDGRVARPLTHFASAGGGTLFLPPRAARGRKAWLAGRITVAGTLVVDAGAAGSAETRRFVARRWCAQR